MSEQLRDALIEALEDEYKARATYRLILAVCEFAITNCLRSGRSSREYP